MCVFKNFDHCYEFSGCLRFMNSPFIMCCNPVSLPFLSPYRGLQGLSFVDPSSRVFFLKAAIFAWVILADLVSMNSLQRNFASVDTKYFYKAFKIL